MFKTTENTEGLNRRDRKGRKGNFKTTEHTENTEGLNRRGRKEREGKFRTSSPSVKIRGNPWYPRNYYKTLCENLSNLRVSASPYPPWKSVSNPWYPRNHPTQLLTKLNREVVQIFPTDGALWCKVIFPRYLFHFFVDK